MELTRRGQGILDVHSVEDAKLLQRLVAFPPNVHLVAFGPARNLVLAAPPSGSPWLWNRSAPLRKIPGVVSDFLDRPPFSPLPASGARALAWSQSGKWALVGDGKGVVRLYDAGRFRIPNGTVLDEAELLGVPEVHRLGAGPVRSVGFHRGGFAAIGQDGKAAVWNYGLQKPFATWQAHEARANSLQITEDGTTVFTGGLDGIHCWNMNPVQLAWSAGTSHIGVACLHLGSDGRWLAASFLDGWIGIYDASNGRAVWESHGHLDVAAAIAFHPKGQALTSLGWDGQLRQWEMPSGRAGQSVEAPTASSCLAWSRDGERLAIGGSGVTVLDSSLRALPSHNLNFMWDEDCT